MSLQSDLVGTMSDVHLNKYLVPTMCPVLCKVLEKAASVSQMDKTPFPYEAYIWMEEDKQYI